MKRTVAALALLIIAATIIATPCSASISSYRGPNAGFLGASSMNVPQDSHVRFNVSGTTTFDVLVMTGEDLERMLENQSYGYISNLSRLNITNATIEGDLPSGDYVIAIVLQGGGGEVWISDPVVTALSSDVGITVSAWTALALVIVTAVGSSLVTYYFFLRKRG